MTLSNRHLLPRRNFCFCCTGAGFAATGGWLTSRAAFAEARGLVSPIKDSAATAPPFFKRKLPPKGIGMHCDVSIFQFMCR